jgi:hypothetical protein
MGRYLLPLAIVLAIGFWIGQRSMSAKKVIEEKTVTVHELDDETKNKLQALTESEIADYYRLKTLEEKYKKADEILGKIMQIFLADLGLKISQQTQNLVKHPPELTKASAPPPPKPETKSLPASPQPKREHYYSIASVKSLTDIDQFLALAKIEGEPSYRRLNLPFSNREDILAKLKGTYVGSAQIVESGRSPRTWDILFQLDGTYEGNHFNGQFYAKLVENGRTLGQVSGIGQLREYSSDPFGLMINIGMNTVLQLYYFPNLNVIGGHVYKIKLGGLAPVGSFQLKPPDDPTKVF